MAKRGGKRPGAGRKPLPKGERMVPLSVSVPAYMAAAIKAQGNPSEFARRVFAAALNRSRKERSDMKRSGFTMIELLVVMAIMAVIVGLTITVYSQSVATARRDATRSTVLQLHRAVMYRSQALAEYNVRGEAQSLKAQYDTAGNPSPHDRLPMELATILVRKNRFRAAFPQRLEDLWGYDAQPGGDDDSPLWAIWKQTLNDNGIAASDATPRPAGHRLDLENCELLYLFLKEGEVYGDSTFDVGRINPAHLQETNRNGIPEIVDSYGKPIRFYNWPTRLVRPGGNGQSIDQATFTATARQFMAITPPPTSPFPANEFNHPLNQDPDDVLGAMSAAQATGYLVAPFALNKTPFGASPTIVTVPAFDEDHYHTSDTFHAPLILSGGPDERLGLVEPTEQATPERRTADVLSVDDAIDNVSILP